MPTPSPASTPTDEQVFIDKLIGQSPLVGPERYEFWILVPSTQCGRWEWPGLSPPFPAFAIGVGTCGRGNGAEGLYYAFAQAVEGSGDNLDHAPVGCFGACFQELLVSVPLPGNPLVMLRKVQANDAVRLLHDIAAPLHFAGEVSRSEFDNRPARLRLGIFSFL